MRIFQTVEEGNWVDTELKHIKNNTMFRIFDDGIQFKDGFGYSIVNSLSDAYLNDNGIWQIDIMDCIGELRSE